MLTQNLSPDIVVFNLVIDMKQYVFSHSLSEFLSSNVVVEFMQRSSLVTLLKQNMKNSTCLRSTSCSVRRANSESACGPVRQLPARQSGTNQPRSDLACAEQGLKVKITVHFQVSFDKYGRFVLYLSREHLIQAFYNA